MNPFVFKALDLIQVALAAIVSLLVQDQENDEELVDDFPGAFSKSPVRGLPRSQADMYQIGDDEPARPFERRVSI